VYRFAKRSVVHAWIACVAILFSVLAPALSQAFEAPAGPAESVEICTSTGPKFVSITRADSAQFLLDCMMGKSKHCGYCAVHDHPLALLPPANSLAASIATLSLSPPLFYRARHTLFAWTVAQSRAPPAST
jgi:hypothetical protein